MYDKKKQKDEKGITLIALVITVIVMLIIAGVAISAITTNGIPFGKMQEAANSYNNEAEKEGDMFNNVLSMLNEAGTDNTQQGNWVSPDEIYDSTGKDESKLHIGDYINYDAGSWTAEEIESIKTGLKGSEETANGSADKPDKRFQFGGFTVGSSRNGNYSTITTGYRGYREVREVTEGGKKDLTGWRVFDIKNGEITLISAGCPEMYRHGNDGQGDDLSAYGSEYILTGNINESALDLELEEKFTKRSWDMYAKGIDGAKATVLTMQRLADWAGIPDLNYFDPRFENMYGKSSETIVDNDIIYWLCTKGGYIGGSLLQVDLTTNGPYVSFIGNYACGVRVLVTLPSDIKLSKERIGTKTVTLTNPDLVMGTDHEYVEYNYNVWDLKK